MAFVHSLVKAPASGKKAGWVAPVELGEDAPHYISFVIPLDDDLRFFNKYKCEIIMAKKDERILESRELIKNGTDSFSLRLSEVDFWFTVRPSPKREYRLPYVGKLGHEDFKRLFIEIEPEDPASLDTLFEKENAFIIGCEPFVHYTRSNKLVPLDRFEAS
jgi:hypothetical protein